MLTLILRYVIMMNINHKHCTTDSLALKYMHTKQKRDFHTSLFSEDHIHMYTNVLDSGLYGVLLLDTLGSL